MNRIKLPGSRKTKNIILAILVIISIALLIKIAIDNNEQQNYKEQLRLEQEAEDKRIEEETAKAEQKANNLEKTKEAEAVKEDEEENKMYDDAFTVFHSGEYSKAIEKANAIIAKFPNSYKSYNIRGIAKAYNGSFSEGMKDIDKALEIKSDYGYARFNKALNYELNSDFDNALVWYDKALEVEEYLWSYYGKASIYGRRGDVKNTVAYLKKALEIAKKENVEADVKKEARGESDFNPVKQNAEFQKLVN